MPSLLGLRPTAAQSAVVPPLREHGVRVIGRASTPRSEVFEQPSPPQNGFHLDVNVGGRPIDQQGRRHRHSRLRSDLGERFVEVLVGGQQKVPSHRERGVINVSPVARIGFTVTVEKVDEACNS